MKQAPREAARAGNEHEQVGAGILQGLDDAGDGRKMAMLVKLQGHGWGLHSAGAYIG